VVVEVTVAVVVVTAVVVVVVNNITVAVVVDVTVVVGDTRVTVSFVGRRLASDLPPRPEGAGASLPGQVKP